MLDPAGTLATGVGEFGLVRSDICVSFPHLRPQGGSGKLFTSIDGEEETLSGPSGLLTINVLGGKVSNHTRAKIK